MTNSEDFKDKFYDDLQNVIASVPKADKLIILDDFNARVGSDHISWDGTIGKYGVGRWNSNRLLLFQTCTVNELLITNTKFCLPIHNRTSWMHPKQLHLIDYVIVRKRDIHDVRITISICGVKCWTIALLYQSLTCEPAKCSQGNKTHKRLAVTKLKKANIR
jgi:hypothetical protein